MAKKILNTLLDNGPARSVDWGALGAAFSLGNAPQQRALWQWTKAYWLLALIVIAGLTVFRSAVVDSIASTPHPALVYIIFAVAAAAAVLCGSLLAKLIAEDNWFAALRETHPAQRDAAIVARSSTAPLAPLFRLIVQTRELPVGQRKQALDHETDSAEIALMGRAALPNLLAGSLVGIGLVGTFVGLLGTLHDLSGVFSSFSNVGSTAGGDSAATFSSMIQKLRGPIQGMGTAFVASLYGLLGSLVIGLMGLSVRRTGDELFSAVRLYVSHELYHVGASLVDEPLEGESELSSSMRILAAVTREEHGKLREGIDQWTSVLDSRLEKVASVTATIGTEIQEAADYVGTAARRSVDSLEKARETNERLFFGMNEVSKGLVDRLDALHKDIEQADWRKQSRIIVVSVGLALFALGVALGTLFAVRGQTAAATAVAPAPMQTGKAQASPAQAGPQPAPSIAAQGAQPNPAVASGEPVAAGQVTADPGDSLSRLAKRHGVPLDELVAANPQIRNTDSVRIGEPVALPRR